MTKVKISKYAKTRSPEYAARTRQLIQLGGLIDKVGLAELCGIKAGEDLEETIESLDKAATLLGFLYEAYNASSPTPESIASWKNDGIRLLKESYKRKNIFT